ncbi:UNVERIFIED_CONTAM: hypothetical protein Sradi_1715600 [Sesamum radiatum]|uniref:ENT domain-containing protein n=1 Tax=Sesamum radiatum TaxID=300843 RepID=A0AAW2TU94_SESRA
MRFKKGDKVEVMDRKDVPVSWRAAEILSCIGHTYRVQYDSYPGVASNQMVEMVPLKFLRPRPPLVQGVESCIAGDIVEVFNEYSWKIAAILKVPGVKKTNKRNKIHPQAAAFQNQYLVRLLGCSQELVVDRSDIRMRQTWHDDKWILMGKRAKESDFLGYSGVRSSELNSSDSDACSVGSCSVTNQSPKNCYGDSMPVHCQEIDTLSSDAESSYGSGSQRRSSFLPPKEELEVSIRRLELHAYRSTLEALYASGPLSWEQEALLTNLRIMLHISNDEHLNELKHLSSTKTAISVR